MLFVKNHRIYTRSVSFALPEDMSIVTDPEREQPATMDTTTVARDPFELVDKCNSKLLLTRKEMLRFLTQSL